MKTIWTVTTLSALLLGFCFVGQPLTAQDEQAKQEQAKQEEAKKKEADKATQVRPKTGLLYRASVLENMKLWNPQGEELGDLEDLMIDFDKGQIVYAGIAHGGTAGIGEKLLAVPWKALRVKQAKGEYFLEADYSKEMLDGIEGFDEDEWPLEANPELMKAIK